jgi:hypothetical protein
MPRLVYSSEKVGEGATIQLDSRETVICSIAQTGVLVYLYDAKRGLVGRIMSSIWGARLYKQGGVYKNAQTAQALYELYPDVAEPLQHFKNPVLTIFANAIWHCGSAAEVCAVLNGAAAELPRDAATSRSPVRQPPKPKTVDEAISAYGSLIEKYPTAILDVAMLPVPKNKMKVLLKAIYAEATTVELQNSIEVGFTMLGHFQEGVGRTPIDVAPLGKNATQADIAELEKWSLWHKLATNEVKALLAEWKRFLAGEPIQFQATARRAD